MKIQNLTLALGILLTIPVVARAATVYTDDFSSDAIGSSPTGYTLYGAGDQAPPYTSVADYSTVETGQYSEYTAFTGLPSSTSQAVYLYSYPYIPTTPNQATLTSGQDNEQLTNANVGAKFAANTTYTLNYLAASQSNVTSYDPYTTPPIGVQDVSLDANGSTIAGSTQTFTTDVAQAFSAGPTVTFDTALDPGLVGETIGFTAGWVPDEVYPNKIIGYSDFVLTDALDTINIPEPSTYALLGMGLLLLGFVVRRRSSAN
jgi:hypothetical protein